MKPEVHLEQSDLDELERLCEAATQGPWIQMNGTVMLDDGTDIAECMRLEDDAVFIAAARTYLPALIKRVGEYRLAMDDLRQFNYELRQQISRYEAIMEHLQNLYPREADHVEGIVDREAER